MNNTTTSTTATDSSNNTGKGKRSKKDVPADLAALAAAEREYLLHCELTGVTPRPVTILLLDGDTAARYKATGSLLTAEQRASIAGESERRDRVRATIELAAAARIGENLNAAAQKAAEEIEGAEQVPSRFATLPLPMVAVIGNRAIFGTLTYTDSTRGRTGGMTAFLTPYGGGELVAVDGRDRNVTSFSVASIEDVLEHAKPAKRSHRQSAAE